MKQKLPSMNLLRAFDAAARHLSFKAAAAELFVTPAAISHQIRVLEEELDTQLFRRKNRSIDLTDQGQDYHQRISPALAVIADATQQLLQREHTQGLLIHSIPFIAHTMIVPNLGDFRARHPGLRIGIHARTERVELEGEPLRIAIRHRRENRSDLIHEEVVRIEVTPICAPDYPMHGDCTLIELSSDQYSWPKWQQDWGRSLRFRETLYCDGFQAALTMVRQGLGLAMGYLPILAPQLAAGEIVTPFPGQRSRFGSLYLVYHREDQHNPVIMSFCEWFRSLIAALDPDKIFLPERH